LITSPHNDNLTTVRKLAGRKWRDKLGEFVAEGEDLIAAATDAGWEPTLMLSAAGAGLPGEEVAAPLLARVSQLGSGTRALAVYPQRWAQTPQGPLSVPVARVRGVEELPGRRVALAAGAGRPLAELEEREVTLVVGAEREGLPDDVLAACDEICHIPIRSESLNAAMAATVAMYEVSR
jgi:TrmH family RNA methyltransferase